MCLPFSGILLLLGVLGYAQQCHPFIARAGNCMEAGMYGEIGMCHSKMCQKEAKKIAVSLRLHHL